MSPSYQYRMEMKTMPKNTDIVKTCWSCKKATMKLRDDEKFMECPCGATDNWNWKGVPSKKSKG